MLFATLVIATAILGPAGPSNAYKFNFTKEQLDAMPSDMRIYITKTCPDKDMEYKDCIDTCKPDCYSLRKTRCLLICEPGCQCKKGLFFSEGKCVPDCSKENYLPQGIRMGPFSFCFGPCIPFVCECEKGYIRLHNTWGKDRCVSLATCKKLKDRYGNSLPPKFNVSHLLGD